MNRLFLYHHLGLGDHIICHGIVRTYAERYGPLAIFCKPQNLNSVASMYSDLDVWCIPKDDAEVLNFIKANPNLNYKFIGFGQLNAQEPFDQQFYKLADVNFEARYKNFYCPESMRENTLFSVINPPEDYVLVHEDTSRGFSVTKLHTDLPVIHVNPVSGFSLTDYIKLAAAAKEIHVIDSSLMFFVDYTDRISKEVKLFVHRYARINPSWQLPTLNKNWSIIN
jgi:hypothetical protein